MKIRKLLAVTLMTALLCGSVNVNAYAAEATTAETVTDVESTEESTNENTEAGNSSLAEENAEEAIEKMEAAESEEASTEAEETVTEEAEAEEKTEKEEKKTEKKTSAAKSKKASYTKEELRLMSAIIFCEAGAEPYAGKLAVGIVVMNRVESKSFPNTIKSVLYQKYQFQPTRNGSFSKALASYDAGKFTTTNHKECIKAAKAALEGVKSVTYKGKKINMKNTLFFSRKVAGAKFSIAHHQFK